MSVRGSTTGRRVRPRSIALALVSLHILVSLDARAQANAEPVRLKPLPPEPALSMGLTSSQLHAFAAVVGEEESVVAQRLLWDPRIAPLAAAAADARVQRRQRGTLLIVTGFGLLAVGTVVGAAMVLSGITPDHTCPYEGGSNCDSGGNDGEVDTGFAIMLVSTALGLPLGISGIVKNASPSETEKAALDVYSLRSSPPMWPPSPRGARGGLVPAKTTLRLLSVRF